MDEKYFNVPIRRDIIHNVFRYERHSTFKRTKRVKTPGDVSGSGKKPRPQKQTGRARTGNKRAPLNYHGGKIFGPVPKDYFFPLNKKIILEGIKSILTARLVENKIIFINSEEIPNGSKLSDYLTNYKDKKVLFVTPHFINEDFIKNVDNKLFIRASVIIIRK